jgi:hypothetical protein
MGLYLEIHRHVSLRLGPLDRLARYPILPLWWRECIRRESVHRKLNILKRLENLNQEERRLVQGKLGQRSVTPSAGVNPGTNLLTEAHPRSRVEGNVYHRVCEEVLLVPFIKPAVRVELQSVRTPEVCTALHAYCTPYGSVFTDTG